jgi:hypothetical protein
MKVKHKEKSGNLHLILENQWEIDLLASLIGSTSDKLACELGKPATGYPDVLYESYIALDNYAFSRKTLQIKLEK